MKVLLDACVWGGAQPALIAAGHDAIHAGDWPSDPGDEAILRQALDEGRVLVTLDKDFGELAIVHGQPHAGIIRLVEIVAREQGTLCNRLLEQYGAELANGAIVTATAGRIRVRKGPEPIRARSTGESHDQER